jgi:1-acyl-sn-glycerol-3-phosphate acyltransferase
MDMERDSLRGELLALLAEMVPERSLDGIRDDESFRNRLRFGSMDLLALLLALKKRYGVEVRHADYGRLSSLGSCISYLEERLGGRGEGNEEPVVPAEREPPTTPMDAAGKWARYLAATFVHLWLAQIVRRRILGQGWVDDWPSVRTFCRAALDAFGAKLEWLDRSGADPQGQYLLAANHRSWLDQVAVVAGHPRPIHVVSKKGYFDYPLLGSAMRMAECIPVEGKTLQPETLERFLGYLERGDSALFFVEGTRGAGLDLLPFREGVFRCSAATGIPVLPLFILGSERLMSKRQIGRAHV